MNVRDTEKNVGGDDITLVRGEDSVSGCCWRRRETSLVLEKRLSQHYGMSAVVARLLASRGYGISDETHALLHGDDMWEEAMAWLDRMAKAYEGLVPLPQAAKRCLEGLCRQETIGIFTDYDVDGACAAAILVHALRA